MHWPFEVPFRTLPKEFHIVGRVGNYHVKAPLAPVTFNEDSTPGNKPGETVWVQGI